MIWFRGLLAISVFRKVSTKVLAIQGNFGDSNRQSFLRAQVESQVQNWGGIFLHPAARGMLEFLRLAVPDEVSQAWECTSQDIMGQL